MRTANDALSYEAPPDDSRGAGDDGSAPFHAILEALQGLRFGNVTVNVQDGVIVQVERVEKRRIVRVRSSRGN